MEPEIPLIVETLYRFLVTEPDPSLWPECLLKNPVKGHGLWSFYQGLRLGIQIADASLEKL